MTANFDQARITSAGAPNATVLRFNAFGQPARPPAVQSSPASPPPQRSPRPLSRELALGLAPYLGMLCVVLAVGT